MYKFCVFKYCSYLFIYVQKLPFLHCLCRVCVLYDREMAKIWEGLANRPMCMVAFQLSPAHVFFWGDKIGQLDFNCPNLLGIFTSIALQILASEGNNSIYILFNKMLLLLQTMH